MMVLAILLSMIGASPGFAAEYFSGPYPADHWALHYPAKGEEGFIARFSFRSHQYAAIVHPLDSRGYRSLVLHVAPDMASTLNRPFTLEERQGLQQVMGVVAEAYESLGLIAQLEVLGNNAHVFDPETCVVTLGSAHEPSILHGHVIGRGNPEGEFVPGITLKGPPPGDVFDARANMPGRWIEDQRVKVAEALARPLTEILNRHPWLAEQGLTLDEVK